MQFLGVIPSRFASSRFPGKPLIQIQGKSMIQRVYEQASKAKSLDQVIVATDDQRIFDHVIDFGGKAMMTSENHPSGTDRCNEVVQKLALENLFFDVIVNIQGDEPFIDPAQIEQLCSSFKNTETEIATLIKPIEKSDELNNPNSVKVVRQTNGNALYFSRFGIPFARNKETLSSHTYFKHLGIYAYRAAVLTQICELPKGKLEEMESLEQLRWLENGFNIQTEITHFESFAIDTPEDLLKLTNNS
ncbi:MAG TPA: 3-deoxy-manno-octulosonate cytidylyltransferase [Bacteroidales bacterium]|nr:3-deoxy-manno-octulosonate cytidylyltransferase [Bacteroidales bacterium]